jgi:hypothetical protein
MALSAVRVLCRHGIADKASSWIKRVTLRGGVRREFYGFINIDQLRSKPMAVLPVGRERVQTAVRDREGAYLVLANLPLDSIAKVQQYFDHVIHGEPSKG